jgi:aspartyl protease family protein
MRLPTTLPLLALATALLAPLAAHSQNVALAGVLGSKALLVIDASEPRSLAPGQEYMGVKLISVGRDEAVIQTAAGRRTLLLGEAPVSLGGSGGGQRLVLKADARGHFVNTGFINNRIMQYMVDTGASTVAIGRPEAERLGLKFQAGQPVHISTANGQGKAWRIRLDSVRVGDLEVHGVDAVVTSESMPYVLLGNSFLSRFQMSRSGGEMVLLKP